MIFKSTLRKFRVSVVLLLIVMISIQSCYKIYNAPQQCSTMQPASYHNPQITSFTPLTGPKGTIITITGFDFSTNTAENRVSFNGIRAQVTLATATSLTVVVPQGAGDGKIALSIGNNSNSSPADFTYVYTVSTLAGDTIAGNVNGFGKTARFEFPNGVATDAVGNVYVSEVFNNQIRMIWPSGMVTTFSGTPGTGNTYKNPAGIAVDVNGYVYVADTFNHRILKLTPGGTASVLAGGNNNGLPGFVDGPGNVAQFKFPEGVAVDALGNVYVADTQNNRIRKITPTGIVSTLAGDGTTAQFFNPRAIAIDVAGNLYVTDCFNNRIRKVTPAGVATNFAGDGNAGCVDGPAATARFVRPIGIAIDAAGNLYITDTDNYRIRKVNTAGIVSSVTSAGYGFADGLGSVARFYLPRGITVDAAGTIYVADVGNTCVRKIQ